MLQWQRNLHHALTLIKTVLTVSCLLRLSRNWWFYGCDQIWLNLLIVTELTNLKLVFLVTECPNAGGGEPEAHAVLCSLSLIQKASKQVSPWIAPSEPLDCHIKQRPWCCLRGIQASYVLNNALLSSFGPILIVLKQTNGVSGAVIAFFDSRRCRLDGRPNSRSSVSVLVQRARLGDYWQVQRTTKIDRFWSFFDVCLLFIQKFGKICNQISARITDTCPSREQ